MKLMSFAMCAALMASSSVFAACEGGQAIFSCMTAKNKQIQVCDFGSAIQYSFGKVGKPEMSLKVPRRKASTYQWQGMGSENYDVSIPNGNTVYRVYDGLKPYTHEKEAGVIVEINGNQVADVKCARSIHSDLMGVDLPPSK